LVTARRASALQIMESKSSPLEIGGVFSGRYRIERRVAAGAMGVVYEVTHIETRRRRALKVMLAHVLTKPDMVERFRREASVAAQIESEHLCEVIDAGVDPDSGAPFIVMELLRGEELGAMVARRGALPREEVVTYLQQAAMALDRTHAAGIVHRDLKPANLFLTHRDDGSPRLKILDFGIAKVMEGDKGAHATKGVLGTPLYISPEQVHGKAPVTSATDVLAIGQIAYTLLVGEAYWAPEEATTETIYQLLVTMMTGPRAAPSTRARERRGVELPAAFDRWFACATALDGAHRFQSVGAAARALAEALGVGIAAGYAASGSGAVAAQSAAASYAGPTPAWQGVPAMPVPVAHPAALATGSGQAASTVGAWTGPVPAPPGAAVPAAPGTVPGSKRSMAPFLIGGCALLVAMVALYVTVRPSAPAADVPATASPSAPTAAPTTSSAVAPLATTAHPAASEEASSPTPQPSASTALPTTTSAKPPPTKPAVGKGQPPPPKSGHGPPTDTR
jgi:eukaryotic-like serine/threonine-protein kinase